MSSDIESTERPYENDQALPLLPSAASFDIGTRPSCNNSSTCDENDDSIYNADISSINQLESNEMQQLENFTKLFEGSSLSITSFNCCFMKVAIKNNLSYNAMDDLLDLFAYVCPKPNSVPSSIYMLKKFFKNYEDDAKTAMYCTNCECLKDKCKCENPVLGHIVSVPVEKPIKSILCGKFSLT